MRPGHGREERNTGQRETRAMRFLNENSFQHHVDFFNVMEPESTVHHVPNREAWTWMQENIPLFECPDKAFEQIYYSNWVTWAIYRRYLVTGR